MRAGYFLLKEWEIIIYMYYPMRAPLQFDSAESKVMYGVK